MGHAGTFAFKGMSRVVICSMLANLVPASIKDAEAGTSSAIITLSNGVSISSQCGTEAPGTQHVTYMNVIDHEFLGYGVNMTPPGSSTKNAQAIADIQGLDFKYVKLDWGDPFASDTGPQVPPYGSTYSQAYPIVYKGVSSAMSQTKKDFAGMLRSNGIQLVKAMYGAPSAYTTTQILSDGSTGTYINPDHITDFGVFYTAYLQSLTDLGMAPDYVELQNEPNGNWNVKYTPDQFAELVQVIEQNMAANSVAANLTISGTSTLVQNGVDFMNAVQARTGLAGIKAIAIHTYYVADAPNNNGIPPADDPALQVLYDTAKAAGMFLMSSEFGGTDLKMKNVDPNLESVNPAEEMKAALDLIRQGESTALVWDLYPNMNGGQSLHTWCLIDEIGPTNAYWPFKALSMSVQPGASVLKLKSTDIVPDMRTLGHAAFKNSGTYQIGLTNPSKTDTIQVSVDISGAPQLLVDHAYSFTSTSLIDQPANIAKQSCPLTVTLPAGSGVVIDMMGAPNIFGQPASQTVYSGTQVTLSAQVSGDAQNTYQWQKNGVNIAGATSRTYSFIAGSSTVGSYVLKATNAAGTTLSDPAVVQIYTAPLITTQPVGGTYTTGSTMTLTVGVSTNLTPKYQWYFGSQAIAGATSATYSIANIQKTNAGNYHVVVTNGVGSVTSTNASIAVYDPIVITKQPQSKSVPTGNNTVLGVRATGSGTLLYQWYLNGVPIAGATAYQYHFVAGTQTIGTYTVKVYNQYVSTLSDPAVVTLSK